MNETILQRLEAKLATYPAGMVAGCQHALEQGVFYQDAFAETVISHMGGFGVEPVLVKIVDVRDDAPLRTHGEQDKELRSDIKALPRGHYGLIRWKPEARPYYTWQIRVSDGTGKIGVGGEMDHYDSQPTGEKVLERMLGYEIYCCRKDLEQKRAILADIEALQTHKMHVGMTFKNLPWAGKGTFSTAVIKAIYPETGQVDLLLSKRGTRNKWQGTRTASRLAHDAELESSKPTQELVVAQTADSLF